MTNRIKGSSKKPFNIQKHEYSTPIFSSKPGGWQMDTVFPTAEDKRNGTNALLWFQNVNTHQIKTVELDGKKDKFAVEQALNRFKDWADKHNQPINSITSDKDPSYQTDEVLNWYTTNKVNFNASKNHGTLGILNRGVKNIRWQVNNDEDESKNTFNPKNVKEKIKEYNNRLPPNFNEGHSPNQMARNRDLELSYIAGKMNEADRRREKAWKDNEYYEYKEDKKENKIKKITKEIKAFDVGDEVRRFDTRPDMIKGHGVGNLYKQKYTVHAIDKLSGQVWLGDKDSTKGLVKVPRYEVLGGSKFTSGNKYAKIDESELTKKVASITGDDGHGNYDVIYENGDKDTLTNRQLRGNKPNNPLRMELDYWTQKEKNKKAAPNHTHIQTRHGGNVYNNLPSWLKEHLPDDFKQTPKVELKSK